MFWPFLAASAVAIALIKLGALAVWVSVLTSMLSLVLAAAFVAGLVYAWRRYRSQTNSK